MTDTRAVQKRIRPRSAFSPIVPRKRSCSSDYALQVISCQEDTRDGSVLDAVFMDDDMSSEIPYVATEGETMSSDEEDDVLLEFTHVSSPRKKDSWEESERSSSPSTLTGSAPPDSKLSPAESRLQALFEREKRLSEADETVTEKTFTALDNKGFTSHLRQHMVRWLMKFQQQLELTSLSVSAAVNILYRYVARNSVPIANLDLATLTAMWVATKIHEEDDLALDDLCRFLQKRHSKQSMIHCERSMSHSLGYSLICSTDLEVAHQTLELCTPKQREAVHAFVDVILDTCLLDTELANQYNAGVRGVASVLASLGYSGFEDTNLAEALQRIGLNLEDKRVTQCVSLFRKVLERTCGPSRSESPVSVFFGPH